MDTKSLSLEIAKFTVHDLFEAEALQENGLKSESLLKQVRDLNSVLIRILESEV